VITRHPVGPGEAGTGQANGLQFGMLDMFAKK
jgi:hypothetical protein